MTEQTSGDDTLSRRTVERMVHHLQPSWEVRAVERSAHGTDFVAVLDVDAPDGGRRVVLKASTAAWVAPETARAEPRLLALVGKRTDIPVPAVYGYCDDHPELPAPFFLTNYVRGHNHEHDLPARSARERILRDAGLHLAELHALDILSPDRVGRVGVQDEELTVLDTDEHASRRSFHDWLLANYEETVDSLADGGYFAHLADDPDRFADLVPDLRAFLRERLPALPDSNPPVVCHNDYRYGNLLVERETGVTRAVLDWGILTAGAPAHNLAKTESMLLTPDEDDPDRTAALRRRFRSAYAEAREGWTFDTDTRERMDLYRFLCRLDAMACLPLWHEDASPAERDERAAEHRAFVRRYL